MLYYVQINKNNIIGYDVINKAKLIALELKQKYPSEKITIYYNTWHEGTKKVKGQSFDNYIEI